MLTVISELLSRNDNFVAYAVYNTRTMTVAQQTKTPLKTQNVAVRLVRDEAELEAAQELRYNVFYKEYGALPSDEMRALERDFDKYDPYAEHLVVTDIIDDKETIVGTYRLMRQEGADKVGQFYSSDEYDLSPLHDSKLKLLELGRSCVMPQYRARPVIQLLWQGIAEYITANDIDIMFGCASFHNADIDNLAPALSYLHHFHKAPAEICPRAVKGRYINMDLMEKDDLNVKAVFSDLPPLIKGYLRVGASIGDGAVIDPQFNTTDVCIVAQTKLVTDRYRKHYNLDKDLSVVKTDPLRSDDQ